MDITQGLYRTNINYTDLLYDGVVWDRAGFSIAGEKSIFWNAKFIKAYEDKRSGRETLYRIKNELDKKYKSSSTKREDGNEFFWYADAEGFVKGGEVGLGFKRSDLGIYMLILQYRIKAVQALLEKDNREFIQGLREGGEDLEGIREMEIENTITRIESESW